MKVSELTRMLRNGGCKLVGYRAEHDDWYSPLTNIMVRVPRHRSKEMATGTAVRILKDAGLK